MNKFISGTIALLIAVPFLVRGTPFLLLYPGSTLMVLFNHEVRYLPATQTLVFFNPNAIHSFFPLSYIFAKVLLLYVPSPVLVEFVFPAVITFFLLAALAVAWLRGLPPAEWYLSWFAIGSLSLLYIVGTAAASSLWFSSIGLWALLAFLCLLRAMRGTSIRSRSASLIALLLLAAMLLGDDGVAFFAALIALSLQALLAREGRTNYLGWAMLSGLMFLAYEAAIGFIGDIYYGTYLPVLGSQLSDLLTFNFQFSTHLSYLSLPIFQTVGSGAAFLVMFAAVPMMLLGYSLRQRWRLTSLLFPGVMLLVGVALRFSSLVTAQPAYVGALYEYVLYLALPVAILAAVRARVGGKAPSPSMGQLRRYGFAFFVIVSICVLVLSTFQFNPLIPTGSINSVTDQRIEPMFVQAAGAYTDHFAPGAVATEQLGDTTVLFVNPSNYSSSLLLASPLPSPFNQQFKVGPKQALYYSNGPILLVSK